jgi:hypothetical protein
MNLGHLGDIIGQSQLTGWRSVALFLSFSGTLIFDELFEITHPPLVAWQPYVPSQLKWMLLFPAWSYLVSLTLGVGAVGVAYLTSYRRRLTLTVYRKISRLFRPRFARSTLPAWLFSQN